MGYQRREAYDLCKEDLITMDIPVITKENTEALFESKYANLYKLHYGEGEKFYYDATRRKKDDLVAVKSDEEFRNMKPDAVSCFVIMCEDGKEPMLLLSREFRYVTGQFITGVPAGLLDPEDTSVISAAKRELFEETGIKIEEKYGDRIFVVNPLVFSTPGFTDESNALVCAVIHPDKHEVCLTQEGAVGKEIFSGFVKLSRDDALKMLKDGVDDRGIYYSVYTWMSLMYFVSEMWK